MLIDCLGEHGERRLVLSETRQKRKLNRGLRRSMAQKPFRPSIEPV